MQVSFPRPRYAWRVLDAHQLHCARTSLALILTLFCMSAVNGRENSGGKVSILETGIYLAETVDNRSMQSTTGIINRVKDVTLLYTTTNVPGRKGVRFGMRYIIGGIPRASIDMTFVVRFPSSGLYDPATGRRHVRSVHSGSRPVGVPLYREYQLEHDWEVVPGVWSFEFWHHNRKLGQQDFCVVLVPHSSDRSVDFDADDECTEEFVS